MGMGGEILWVGCQANGEWRRNGEGRGVSTEEGKRNWGKEKENEGIE